MRLDNALSSFKSISNALNDVNKGHISVGVDALRKITLKNRKKLLLEGTDVFNKMVRFMAVMGIFLNTLSKLIDRDDENLS
jgi:hypothetical protein